MKINRDMIDIFLLFGYLNFGSVEFDTGSRIKRVLLWLNLQLNWRNFLFKFVKEARSAWRKERLRSFEEDENQAQNIVDRITELSKYSGNYFKT